MTKVVKAKDDEVAYLVDEMESLDLDALSLKEFCILEVLAEESKRAEREGRDTFSFSMEAVNRKLGEKKTLRSGKRHWKGL